MSDLNSDDGLLFIGTLIGLLFGFMAGAIFSFVSIKEICFQIDTYEPELQQSKVYQRYCKEN